MADDDLLNPDEIEALLNQSGANASPASADSGADSSAGDTGGSEQLSAGDIESLLSQDSSAPAASQPASAQQHPTEQLLNQAEADLASAISPDLIDSSSSQDFSAARPFNLQQLGKVDQNSSRMELNVLKEVDLDLRIELGRTELLIEEVVSLSAGSVVPLDKLAGDPVDILVNGRLIARGEVLVLNENFCVRVAEILTPED